MPGLLDKILNADTTTDLEELYDREVPCELGKVGTTPAPWCVDIGDWLMMLQCRKCGHTAKMVACIACKQMVQRVWRPAQLIMLFSKSRHCPHRLISFRLKWRAL